MPSTAQYSQDSLLIQFFGNEAAVEEWKSTQKDAYSFDYLLQKPSVAKHYKNKKFGDHLFIEGGVQALSHVSHSEDNGIHFNNIVPWGYVGIGDWMTPLHGWRLSFQAGNYMFKQQQSKILGASLDYMLNLNAVASPTYDQPKPFEVYGIAGADIFRSETHQKIDYAWGLHIGLRGQYHVSPYTYLFLEPRLGVYTDELIHKEYWRKYILAANAIAGVGYRLNPANRKGYCYRSTHFLDDTFISIAGGASNMLNLGSRFGFSRQFGAIGQISAGKWFNPFSAVRLTAGAALQNQPKDNRTKAVHAGIGYMWNMHNTFGDYKPERKYWVNAVADVHANVSTSGNGRKTSFGFGAGLQPNVRIAKGVELFLEPRIDFYDKNYVSTVGKNTHFDAFGSLLAGVTFRQGNNSCEQISRNDDFEQKSWFDHLFFEGGVGATMPFTHQDGTDVVKHLGINTHIGVGKWFNATSGLRLWGDIGRYEDINSKTFEAFGIGADYLWNLTNALHGYVPSRPCELIASVGINTTAQMEQKKYYFGGNIGLKGIWNLNPMLGLYLEPQLRIYNKDFMPRSSFVGDKVDIMALMMAGVNLRLNGYKPGAYTDEFDGDERRSFISVAGGLASNLDHPRTKEQYAVLARLSYGHWFTPISAWRINAGAKARMHKYYRQALVHVGADYMTDLTTLAYGYNADRLLSLRSFVGANIGMEYQRKTDGKAHFASDLHAGAQLAIRAGRQNEIFVEPELSYTLGNMPNRSKQERMEANLYAGVTHKLQYTPGKKVTPADASTNDFVSLSVGSGVHTRTILHSSPKARRLSIDLDASYGHWFNSVSGFRGGVSTTTLFRSRHQDNLQLTTLHTDYMLNLLTLSAGEVALEQPWTLTAFAGISYNFGTTKQKSPGFAVGGQLGLQAGYKVSKHWEVFASTHANIMSNKVWHKTGRKIDGHVNLMFGTQYYF